MSAGTILTVAILSFAIAGGASYWLFNSVILSAAREEKKTSRRAKVKYWCAYLSMIAVMLGSGTIIMSLVFGSFDGARVDFNRVATGAVTVVFYPLIFAVGGWFILLFVKDSSSLHAAPVNPGQGSDLTRPVDTALTQRVQNAVRASSTLPATMHINAKPGSHSAPVEHDEDTLASVLAEAKGEGRRPGLWAKCFLEASGNETDAVVRYMNVRLSELSEAASATTVPSEEPAKTTQDVEAVPEPRESLATPVVRQSEPTRTTTVARAPEATWVDRLLSGPSLAAMLVALVGYAVFKFSADEENSTWRLKDSEVGVALNDCRQCVDGDCITENFVGAVVVDSTNKLYRVETIHRWLAEVLQQSPQQRCTWTPDGFTCLVQMKDPVPPNALITVTTKLDEKQFSANVFSSKSSPGLGRTELTCPVKSRTGSR